MKTIISPEFLNDCTFISELTAFLPKPCINECSAIGQNYCACERWVKRLGLNIPREICIKELKEVDVWDEDELLDESDHELNIKFLWVAAGYE